MRRILSVLCAVLVSVTMIFCKPLPRVEASSAAVGYTAYEIISLIMAVCGGGVLKTSQGLIGGNIAYDPAQMYNAMNTYRSGLGNILSSYVARGSYLGTGSILRINEADFEAFKEYFENNDIQEEFDIAEVTRSNVNEVLTQFIGAYNVEVGNDQYNFITQNNDCVAISITRSGTPNLILCKNSRWQRLSDNKINLSDSSWCTWTGGYWVQISSQWDFTAGTLKVMPIRAQVGAKYNSAVYDVSKAGKLDNVSRTRKYNSQTQEYEGDVSIAMPRAEVLDEVLAQEDISGLYDAINAYPVNTADDTMVLYPSASATDFVVPEIAINQTIAFPAIDGTASNYTMDLTNFFPFCIPFDIVAFIQLFEADAEAPSVTYPFPYVTSTGQIGTVEQTVSLSQFDGVAALVRRLELIAFIIGLAVVTRSWFLRG